jgi:prevent-host-death family protein
MYILVYTFRAMTYVLPITEARNNLLRLVDLIEEEYSRVDLTKNGKVKASIISSEYLDSLEETIYSLKFSSSDVKEAEKEINKGLYLTLAQFKKKLTKRNAR